MSLGKRIAAARNAKGFSQAKLAELLGVSPEAVSKWERDAYKPGRERLQLLEERLNLASYDEDGELRDMRLFDEEHMSAFLKGKLNAGDLPQALRALSYAKEKHAGTYRQPVEAKIPYISHPLTMACHALAMGLKDDELLAALLLHDVVEDCDVRAEELPFPETVQKLVALVTKSEASFDESAYYAAISEDPRACMVKCIDRCNNLSTMAVSFTESRRKKYIRETEEWYPQLLRIIKEQPAYNNAAWLLEYQMRSLLETAKRIV